MYNQANQNKVRAEHLKRDAYLYIRQSSMKQVIENHESTLRQYELRHRAVALGWKSEQIKIIDCDQGHSGSRKVDRDGFKELVAQVSMGNAGIVMGLEVSRLARNNADWHNLLELCSFSGTLILDQDGLYDARLFNDRLLLGLKGAMSEAELHVLKSRLLEGMWNKARRGELKILLPSGFTYDDLDRVVLDPDKQVQESIRLLFSTFEKLGSACQVVRDFRDKKFKLPVRRPRDPQKGELLWKDPTHSQVMNFLRQPRYAGAFCYGKTQTRCAPDGKRLITRNKIADWSVVIKNAHPSYITWEQYESNLKQLKRNSGASNLHEHHLPPQNGVALLQGIVVCGKCGKRMTIRYHNRKEGLIPSYMCQRDCISHGEKACQTIHGKAIDEAIEKLVLKCVNKCSLDIAINIQNELRERTAEADKLRKLEVDRVRYEAELAQRRFMKVAPENRLVADTLEADWNEKLRILDIAQQEYEKQREKDSAIIDKESQRKIMELSSSIPRLWNAKKTTMRDRKRIINLLVEDVTLTKDKNVTAFIRFRGGKTESLSVPLPKKAWEAIKTSPEVIDRIDRLLDEHTGDKIAGILNSENLAPGRRTPFTAKSVLTICREYHIKPRLQRLREKGYITLEEVAKRLNVNKNTAQIWNRKGMLKSYPYNSKNECLFEPPGEGSPTKQQGLPFNQRKQFQQFNAD